MTPELYFLNDGPGDVLPHTLPTSTPLESPVNLAIDKLEKAQKELGEMCERQWAGGAAIRWRIPAEKSDSDMVIFDAIETAISVLKTHIAKTEAGS